MLKWYEIRFFLNYLLATRLLCWKNPLWAKSNYHLFMMMKLQCFYDVITLIKKYFTWDKRHHLVSIFHPWLVLIYMQNPRRRKRTSWYTFSTNEIRNLVTPLSSMMGNFPYKFRLQTLMMWLIMKTIMKSRVWIKKLEIPSFCWHIWHLDQATKKMTNKIPMMKSWCLIPSWVKSGVLMSRSRRKDNKLSTSMAHC